MTLIRSMICGIMDDFMDTFSNWLLGVISFIPKLLYALTLGLFALLDFFETLFGALSGTGEFSFSGATNYNVTIDPETGEILLNGVADAFAGDPVLYFIQQPAIQSIFWSMVALAILLLIVFTFIAVIKSEFQVVDDLTKAAVPKNNKYMVFRNSIIAIFYGLLIPAISIGGIMMGNVLLRALDDATSPNTSDLLSRQLFVASFYNANRMRSDDLFIENFGDDNPNNYWSDVSAGLTDATKNSAIATQIDNAFLYGTNYESFTGGVNEDYGNDYYDYYQVTFAAGGLGTLGGEFISSIVFDSLGGGFNIYNTSLVFFYYDLWNLSSMLIAWAGAILLISCFFQVAFAMIQRFFYITILFVFSPIAISMYPLSAKVLDRWKAAFISNVLCMYAVVVCLNFYFILMPILNRINLFSESSLMIGAVSGFSSQLGDTTALTLNFLAPFFNALFKLLLMIAGAFVIKKAPAYFGEIFGTNEKGGDPLSVGKNLIGDSFGAATKGASFLGKATGGYVSLASKAISSVGSKLPAQKKGISDNTKNLLTPKMPPIDPALAFQGDSTANEEPTTPTEPTVPTEPTAPESVTANEPTSVEQPPTEKTTNKTESKSKEKLDKAESKEPKNILYKAFKGVETLGSYFGLPTQKEGSLVGAFTKSYQEKTTGLNDEVNKKYEDKEKRKEENRALIDSELQELKEKIGVTTREEATSVIERARQSMEEELKNMSGKQRREFKKQTESDLSQLKSASRYLPKEKKKP
ncbi:MAG: hypothetical protein PHO33_02270 [Clostridia bacterium]|nr:hypothetical protein [Clostridia bacterium]